MPSPKFITKLILNRAGRKRSFEQHRKAVQDYWREHRVPGRIEVRTHSSSFPAAHKRALEQSIGGPHEISREFRGVLHGVGERSGRMYLEGAYNPRTRIVNVNLVTPEGIGLRPLKKKTDILNLVSQVKATFPKAKTLKVTRSIYEPDIDSEVFRYRRRSVRDVNEHLSRLSDRGIGLGSGYDRYFRRLSRHSPAYIGDETLLNFDLTRRPIIRRARNVRILEEGKDYKIRRRR